MTGNGDMDSEVRRALRALLSDIEGMYEGAEAPTERGHPEEFFGPFERPIIERIVARPFRDAAFALAVKEAYQNTCAITGLKIINGGGRAEVQAAHIKPVAEDGPDSVRNGLALSSTVHWMFDRGLITIADDYSLILAKGRLPEMVERMVNRDGKLRLPPDRPDIRPHPQFLRFHRDVVFKG